MVTQRRLPAVDGQPAVYPPPRLDLPLVQQQVNHIRDRLAKLDAAVNRAFVVLDANTTPQSVDALAAEVKALKQQLASVVQQLGALTAQASVKQPVYMMVDFGGEDGADGVPIMGPRGPRGRPGPAVFIAGEDGENETFVR